MTWPNLEVATGELVTAAQLNQLPIALAKLQGAGASFDFTNIPQFWTHLLIVACLQDGSNNNSDPLKITFNGDTGANYARNRWRGSNSTDNAQTAAAAYVDGGEVPGKSSGGFAVNTIWIPNYADVQPHQVTSQGYACWDKATAGAQMAWQNGGLWKPSVDAAITRVTLTPGAGSLVAGSRAMLYGMGAF